MKKIIGILAASIFSILPAKSFALTGGTAVVYGNGMMNADGEWTAGSRKIEALGIDNQLDRNSKVTYDVAINRSEYQDNGVSIFAVEELYQVVRQKLGDVVATKFWNWLSGVERMPIEFKTGFLAIAEKTLSSPAFGDTDLQLHIDKYEAYLRGGNCVLLVSHSQGNLYANQAWNTIFQGNRFSLFEKSFGNVQVATPSSTVSAGQISNLGTQLGNWKTFQDDEVMNLVRSTLGALPANLPAEGKLGDPDRGHSFNSYMRDGGTAKTQIVSEMIQIARALEYPYALVDLSTKEQQSQALLELENNAVDKPNPEEVEKGKPIYFEGIGLADAKWEIPGLSQRLTASVLEPARGTRLYEEGTQVYKIIVPSDAPTSDSLMIRALITSGGVEQEFISQRAVRIYSNASLSSSTNVRISGTSKSGISCQFSYFLQQIQVVEFLEGKLKGQKKERLLYEDCAPVFGQQSEVTVSIQNFELGFGEIGATYQISEDYPSLTGVANPDKQENKYGFSQYIKYSREESPDGVIKCIEIQKNASPYSESRVHYSPGNTINCKQTDPYEKELCIKSVALYNAENSSSFGWSPWVLTSDGSLTNDIKVEFPCGEMGYRIGIFEKLFTL